jgi:beta-lactamase superfamily II metal-dependent hydrolase
MRHLAASLVIALAVAVGGFASARDLSIHCLNVGNADCTVIVSPTGRTMMIDAGKDSKASKGHICDYLDSLGISHLNYLVVTHYHNDHDGGVDSLVKHGITIDSVLDRGWSYCTLHYTTEYLPAIDSIRHSLVDGQVLDLGGTVTATVLSVNGNGLLVDTPYLDRSCTGATSYNENDFCVSLLVKYGCFEFFVAGDLSGSNESSYIDIESSVANEAGDIDVYRVNHHGSKYSTNDSFLTTMDPEIAVLSVGKNGYNHPDTGVVRRLDETCNSVYQTADSDGNAVDGNIVISTTGHDSFTVQNDTFPLPPCPDSSYQYAFQNFDDDVDRVKTYSNFFGGDYGITPGNSQILIHRDTLETRTGFGRSLKISYGPLVSYDMYIESFNGKWYDNESCFDLANLFPDFSNPGFAGRHIDSLAFHYKLQSDSILTLKLELKDASDNTSTCTFDLTPSNQWNRKSVALGQFTGNFNPARAVFLGLTFANYPDNQDETGILYVDDFYLIESDYSKPSFANDFEFLDYLNEVNFRHFWMAVEPVSKFALDRHTFTDLISVDAIGFQLTSYVIAHRNGWVDPSDIEERVEHILDYLLHACPHAEDSIEVMNNPLSYATVDGNWAHFLDKSTLARKNTNTEFSLFSNALLLPGVLVCQSYYDWNDNIVDMADSLIRMTNWNFLYIPENQLMHYSWKPESGFSEYCSNWFTEELDLAFLLGTTSPDLSHRLPANPYDSPDYLKPYCHANGSGYFYSASGSNFTYYFLQMYALYPRDKGHSVPRVDQVRNALLNDLAFCKDSYSFLNYDPCIFGTTACEGPDSAGNTIIPNYHAYGYSCRYDTENKPNGTIAVYGSGAATLYIPDEAIACLKYYYSDLDTVFMSKYGYGFWSPIFGFPDAFHLDPDNCKDTLVNQLSFRGPWLSVPRFGIDVGPMLMNIDSYISEYNSEVSIRNMFSQHPYIVDSLPPYDPITDVDDSNLDIIPVFELRPVYPNPFNQYTAISYTVEQRSQVRVVVFNSLGQTMKVLVDREQPMGAYGISWDGTDSRNKDVATGVYFLMMECGEHKQARKMVLLK